MKEIFRKAILPLALAGLIMFVAYYPLKANASGWELFMQMLFFAGIPFGIRKMFVWLVPSGSYQWVVGIFALNFIIGGVIGSFVLIWRIIVAVFVIIKNIVGLFLPREVSE